MKNDTEQKKFVVSTNVSEVESILLNKISSLSGATVSTVARALLRAGLKSMADERKDYFLLGITSSGNIKNIHESSLQKILKKFGE